LFELHVVQPVDDPFVLQQNPPRQTSEVQSLPVVHVPVAFFVLTHAEDDVDPDGLVLPPGHNEHVTGLKVEEMVQMFPLYATAASFVPSDDEVMPYQDLVAPTEASSIQVTPALVDIQMFPLYTTAASFVPSDDEVMPLQDLVAPTEASSIQVTPALVDLQMFPSPTTAASFVPSDDEVMPCQFLVEPTEVSSRATSTNGAMC